MHALLTIAALLLALAATTVSAEAVVVPSEVCDEDNACTVHEVRIDGCKNVANGVCKIKRGQTPVISFDYTPEFAATAAHGQVYWVSSEGDLPFVGMRTDACLTTVCPLVSGARQTYSYNFETSRKYQAKNYNIKWKLSDPETNALCCFQTKISLVK